MKDTNKKRRWKEDWDAEFAEEYGIDPDANDDLDTEDKGAKPLTMILVFIVLIIVAALISVVLWVVTHQKEDTVVLPTDVESSVVDYINPEDIQVTSEDSGEAEAETDINRVVTSDGREVVFTDCDNTVTPKEYVNLRTEPSTAGGESTVYCKVHAGELLHRTGYSPDLGWSRVEYGDAVVYVVTSNVEAVE